MQAHETGKDYTIPKRTQPKPHIARKGKWVEVQQMDAKNGDNHEESYRAGDTVFVRGNTIGEYVYGEPTCLLCEQPSQKCGSDLLECDRCLGAIHCHCDKTPVSTDPQVISV